MLADTPPTVDTPKALKSFEQFRKLKGKQWKSKCSTKTEKEEDQGSRIKLSNNFLYHYSWDSESL